MFIFPILDVVALPFLFSRTHYTIPTHDGCFSAMQHLVTVLLSFCYAHILEVPLFSDSIVYSTCLMPRTPMFRGTYSQIMLSININYVCVQCLSVFLVLFCSLISCAPHCSGSIAN